jgi:hypothetical protein
MELIKNLCKNGDIHSLKLLFEKKNTNEIQFEVECDHVFFFACEYGKLEICKWVYLRYKNYCTKRNAFHYFISACENGQIEICEWLSVTFELKKEINYYYNNLGLYCACINEQLEIIYFLCNHFNFTVEDTKNFIDVIPEEKREKIFECLTPIGSFTKPAKN